MSLTRPTYKIKHTANIVITIYIITKYGKIYNEKESSLSQTRGTFNMYNVSCQDSSDCFACVVVLFKTIYTLDYVRKFTSAFLGNRDSVENYRLTGNPFLSS